MIAASVYITELASRHAEITGGDKEKITTRFFGLTMGSFSVAMLAGNALSSIVMHTFASHRNTTDMKELKATYNAIVNVTLRSNLTFQCGIHNCDCAEESCDLSGNRYQKDVNQRVNSTALYSLTVGFVIMQFIAAMILWWTVIEYPKTQFENEEDTRQLLDQPKHDNRLSNKNSNEEESLNKRIRRNLLATTKFYVNHPVALLNAPFVIHIGLLHAFVLSQVTRDWITCIQGKNLPTNLTKHSFSLHHD